MNCIWQQHGGKFVCEKCGDTRDRAVNRNCPANRCPHLGSPIEGDVITLLSLCRTCTGNVRKKLTALVHECELHGRCLPAYSEAMGRDIRSGEWAKPCTLCPQNPANASREA
jgi:hypothetical protein